MDHKNDQDQDKVDDIDQVDKVQDKVDDQDI